MIVILSPFRTIQRQYIGSASSSSRKMDELSYHRQTWGENVFKPTRDVFSLVEREILDSFGYPFASAMTLALFQQQQQQAGLGPLELNVNEKTSIGKIVSMPASSTGKFFAFIFQFSLVFHCFKLQINRVRAR